MPKGPRVHPDIEQEIATIVLQKPLLQAAAIELILIRKFSQTDIPVPSKRTIQDRAKRIRDRLTVQEKPWSIATMKAQNPDIPETNTGIPWEAVGFIMKSIVDLESMVRRNKGEVEKIWHYTFEFLAFIEERNKMAKKQSASTILTNRQAKWLWRLHLIFPGLNPVDLFPLVDVYAHREMLADYLGWDFDTSDLDGSLVNKMRDITKHGYYPDRSRPSKT